ncbi:hypothetical protein [Paenibacillus solani]|uniref:hypothetical protein n=1 Tax=Paenibacillus solani TaxID=1705565 RepID=UPI003D2CD39F
MGYMEFKPTVKKVNLKPKGEVEIVLATTISELQGAMDSLSNMIDQKVDASLDSLIVSYSIQVNAQTNKPIREYRVDPQGVVSEVKPEGEQLEADLGLPKEEPKIEEKPVQADRDIVDEFILSGLAPSYEDLDYNFEDLLRRKNDGESYMKLASELNISSGKIVEDIDIYRKRVAPLAAKWDEWREGKIESAGNIQQQEPKKIEADKSDSPEEGQKDGSTSSDKDEPREMNFEGGDQNGATGSEDGEEVESESGEISKEDLEQFILKERPSFEDIPLDFPMFLEKRLKEGKTWVEISKIAGIPSSQIQPKWKKYKEMVTKMMKDGGAA